MRFAVFVLLSLSACLFPVHGALPAVDSQGRELPTLAPMLEQVTPAVVNIATLQRVRLRPGDIVVSVNRHAVTSTDELKQIAKGASRMLVHVRRGDGALFLMLR